MSAKDILIKPISAKDSNMLCKKLHYSKKVVPNSQLHFGVFYKGLLEGVMQYGPSLNKKGVIKLVKNTGWNDFIELNRMAFSERLPRNSESRAIGVAHKLIKKTYKNIKWVISFADATQCGDGAIYRASGFYLTDIRENKSLRMCPDTKEPMHAMQAHHLKRIKEFRNWEVLAGYQLRYIYFLYPALIKDLAVPIIPFSKIKELGIGMYRGRRV
jgi:hypothetical protein